MDQAECLAVLKAKIKRLLSFFIFFLIRILLNRHSELFNRELFEDMPGLFFFRLQLRYQVFKARCAVKIDQSSMKKVSQEILTNF